MLQAALLGVQNGYDLQPMETGDGFVETDATIGAASDLGAAVADLSADTVLSAAVGEGLVANHVFMKQAEVEKTKDLDADAMRGFYIYYM